VLQPLIEKLGRQAEDHAPAPAPAAAPATLKWNRGMSALPVKVTASWPEFKVPTRRLMNLQPGQVIELQPEFAEKIELRLGAVLKFRARLGMRNGLRALQITEIVK
jgi:flagellar motor switch protein FliM